MELPDLYFIGDIFSKNTTHLKCCHAFCYKEANINHIPPMWQKGGRPDPLGFNAHLFHICSNSSLSGTDAGFTKFPGDFWGTVVLAGLVINLLDHLFDRL